VGSKTKIPLPLTTITYKTGLTDRVDFFVGWHVLETFMNEGNFFFDVGGSYYFLDQRGGLPGVSAAVTLSPFVNRRAGWASLDLQLTASWAFGPRERHLVYVGFHNFLTPVRSQLIPTPAYTFSPYLGARVRIGPNREVALSGEIKWHRPYQDTSSAVLSYVGLGSQGAIAFVGGVTVHFGKRAAAEQSTTGPGDSPAPADSSKATETPEATGNPENDAPPDATANPENDAPTETEQSDDGQETTQTETETEEQP